MENKPVIIIDTDIGPDCDDMGALAILLQLHNAGYCRLAAVTHCTTNPYGAATADALCRCYGVTDMMIGELQRDKPFLQDCQKYNKYIAENYENRFINGDKAEPAVTTLRRTLATEPDNSVTLCTIGHMPNIADLLGSDGDEFSALNGLELVKKKVKRLVSMAGSLVPGYKEYNLVCDVASAEKVISMWPTEAWISPWELGENIIAGKTWGEMPANHPLPTAYRLYTETENGGRQSYDHTAAIAAALGETKLFSLTDGGKLAMNKDGTCTFTLGDGKFRFMSAAMDNREIASYVDRFMQGDTDAAEEIKL